jgi:hypothetical protein
LHWIGPHIGGHRLEGRRFERRMPWISAAFQASPGPRRTDTEMALGSTPTCAHGARSNVQDPWAGRRTAGSRSPRSPPSQPRLGRAPGQGRCINVATLHFCWVAGLARYPVRSPLAPQETNHSSNPPTIPRSFARLFQRKSEGGPSLRIKGNVAKPSHSRPLLTLRPAVSLNPPRICALQTCHHDDTLCLHSV